MTIRHQFGVFPYLKTSDRVRYRGLEIRPSDDTAGLDGEAQELWQALRGRFFIDDTGRISNPSFVYVPGGPGDDLDEQLLRSLRELQIQLSYLYCAPDPTTGEPFLTDEHATFFCFLRERASKVLVDSSHGVARTEWPDGAPRVVGTFYEGFRGTIDGRLSTWIAETSRVLPPVGRVYLNISQDIAVDLDRWDSTRRSMFHEFARRESLSEFDQRLLTAMGWYNRSARATREADLSLVSLAIALETLLGLQGGDRVTARFKDAVTLLVGPIPRLDDWLVQFYDARSDIVHEGRSDRAMFMVGKSQQQAGRGTPYRPLIAYGRTIFRICAETVLFGARRAEALDMASVFRTNHERFEELCRILDEEESAPADRLQRGRSVVEAIVRYQWIPEAGLTFDRLLGAIKRMCRVYLETNPQESPELVDALTKCASAERTDRLMALDTVRNLVDVLGSPTVRKERNESREASGVQALADVVWHYSFMHYFAISRDMKASDPDANASETQT